jgi:hypothetical protein
MRLRMIATRRGVYSRNGTSVSSHTDGGEAGS